MWLFLRRRLVMWVVLAVAVPLLDWLLGKVSAELKARKGESAVTKGLDSARSAARSLAGKRR